MRLVRVKISNYRAIQDLEVDLDQQTTFVGGNGVGKSCILKAIDRFFSSGSNVSIEDFHNRNTADPIDIALTFSDFSAEEAEAFDKKIFGGQMVVLRRFFAGHAPRDNGRYFGQSLRLPRFQEIRAIDGAVPRRLAFNELCGSEGFEALEAAGNAAEVEQRMQAWEANHQADCIQTIDDGQFFGFTNVGRGVLSKYISFVFIPAVRDARADASDGKSSVIGQLIELVVKSVVQKRADIQEWQEKAAGEYAALVDPENLGELGDLSVELSQTLQVFYDDANVSLDWREPEQFSVALPLADVSLTEQGYTGPVENKGHGLQRAFIFTLLQHLAKVLSTNADDDDDLNVAPADAEMAAEPEASHRVILAIEEPELYQHPVKQRHVANVLYQIAEGIIPGVLSQTQVICCSHSAQFVSTERFPSIRLARRRVVEGGGPPECVVARISYQQVVDRLSAAYENGQYDEAGLRARLHVVDESVNEGFFSQKAVLVEGVGDRAAIFAVAKQMNVDLEARGISIIPVGGKGNLDKPLAIFQLLGIPSYVVFDSDFGHDNPQPQQNIAIQRLCGSEVPEEYRTIVGPSFASFERNLNVTLSEEMGPHFEDQALLVAQNLGMKKSAALKNPNSCAEIIRRCQELGGQCGTLESIVNEIAQ